ncbi:HPP family protein [Candidatus Margulisiibacteriota bacterium]
MKVRNILCNDISSVSPHMTIRTVIRFMSLSRYYAIPIVNEENAYVSCISISDIIDVCVPSYMKSLLNPAFLPDVDKFYDNLQKMQDRKVADYMPKKYPTLHPGDSVNYAADQLERSTRRVIPVVENKQLLGTVSRLEIIAVILKK